MILGRVFSKIVNIICEILAFLTIIFIVLVWINRVVITRSSSGTGFLPVKLATTFESLREILVLVLVALAGLELALKLGLIVLIIYLLFVVAALVLMFFPGVLPSNVANLTESVRALAALPSVKLLI